MPMIAALVAVVAGGGFFAMKGQGSNTQEVEPEIALGTTEPMGEFLVNLADGRTYLRVTVSVQFADHFDVAYKMVDSQAAVQDAIVMTLSSRTLEEIRTLDGKQQLKWKLAHEINRALASKEKSASRSRRREEPREFAPPVNEEGWDHDEGPALKIYFTSFVTQ